MSVIQFLCAYYEPDYPKKYKPIFTGLYGKYQCGGENCLFVFESINEDELCTPNLLWKIPYKSEQYAYIFTEYDNKKSIIQSVLSSVNDLYNIHTFNHVSVILSNNKIQTLGNHVFHDDSLYLNENLLESDDINGKKKIDNF